MLRPQIYTSPFAIVVDTREQHPWDFSGQTKRIKKQDVPIELLVKFCALKTGDYSIEGLEDQICIERKSVKDILQTAVHHKARFERELERMRSFKFSAVIIEGTWEKMLRVCEEDTSINISSFDNILLSFALKYSTHWIYRPSRFTAARTCYKIFDLYWRKYADRPQN